MSYKAIHLTTLPTKYFDQLPEFILDEIWQRVHFKSDAWKIIDKNGNRITPEKFKKVLRDNVELVLSGYESDGPDHCCR